MNARCETLVLCLGNDLRRDDGVGWKVAEELEAAPPPGAVVRKSGLSGFYLLDELAGFARAVVVDAVQTGTHLPGEVFAFPVDAVEDLAAASPHAVGLPTVLRVARQCGVHLPRRIDVVVIEVADVETLGAPLSPPVAAAVPRAMALVRSLAARARSEAEDRR